MTKKCQYFLTIGKCQYVIFLDCCVYLCMVLYSFYGCIYRIPLPLCISSRNLLPGRIVECKKVGSAWMKRKKDTVENVVTNERRRNICHSIRISQIRGARPRAAPQE